MLNLVKHKKATGTYRKYIISRIIDMVEMEKVEELP